MKETYLWEYEDRLAKEQEHDRRNKGMPSVTTRLKKKRKQKKKIYKKKKRREEENE